MSLISASKIKKHLVVLNKWSYENNSLCRQYKFQSYMDGINFVMELAKLSEKHNHHPDIVIGWCTVEVKFTSHDQGGVSEGGLHAAAGGGLRHADLCAESGRVLLP